MLVSCPACVRHVRDDEERCPFCGGPLPGAVAAAVRHTSGRPTRAALVYGAVAGTILLGSACAGYGGPPPDWDGPVPAGEGSESVDLHPEARCAASEPASAPAGGGAAAPPDEGTSPRPR